MLTQQELQDREAGKIAASWALRHGLPKEELQDLLYALGLKEDPEAMEWQNPRHKLKPKSEQ